MDTGYYIQGSSIYGPHGYTHCWVRDGHICRARGGHTACWIEKGYIHSSKGGYTQFYVEGGRIYGPSKTLPWMQNE